MKRRSKIIGLSVVLLAIAGVTCYLAQGPSAEQLLGTSLPAGARVLHVADRAGMFGGDYYAVIEMSEADFRQLAGKIGLVHRPDLLDYWSNALGAAKDVRWWDVSKINDANTLFGDQQHSTYLVARYERGRMYYKVHVY